jgi:hypothetical protein
MRRVFVKVSIIRLRHFAIYPLLIFLVGIDRPDGEIVHISEMVDKLQRHIENDKKIEQRSIQTDPDNFANNR